MMYRCLSLYRDTASDTADTCCIDILLCAHVWVSVSDVSCCIASKDGVKLGVKVMVISEVGAWGVAGRCQGVYSVLEDY